MQKTTPKFYFRLLIFLLVVAVYVFNTVTIGGGDVTLYEGYSIVFNYTATRYSPGGVIRIYMNALPVLVALFYWNRIKMISSDSRIVKWMAIISFIAVPALSLSTTMVDRLGLYLMPIQLAL